MKININTLFFKFFLFRILDVLAYASLGYVLGEILLHAMGVK